MPRSVQFRAPPHPDKQYVEGGFLLKTHEGKFAPFKFRDLYSAQRFVAMHPWASLTHYTRKWVIIREIDQMAMKPPSRQLEQGLAR